MAREELKWQNIDADELPAEAGEIKKVLAAYRVQGGKFGGDLVWPPAARSCRRACLHTRSDVHLGRRSPPHVSGQTGRRRDGLS
jgi:hypothetical protein